LQTDEKPKTRRVLETVREYTNKGINYQCRIIKGQGQTPLVTAPQEYQILIDTVEKGLDLITAMYHINEYRDEENLSEVELSTIRRTMKIL
jgi:hypothetical protein